MVPTDGDGERVRRDRYPAVGAATRAAITRAAQCDDLTEIDYRVVLGVVHLLSSWSRLEDRVGTRQLTSVVYGVPVDDAGGWRRRRVTNALHKLDKRGVLAVSPGRGPGARTRISFPRDVPSPPSDGVALTTPSEGGDGIARGTPLTSNGVAAAAETYRGDDGKVSPPRGHSENSPEDSPELSTRAHVDDALTALADAFPTQGPALRRHRKLRTELTAQLDSGWTTETLMKQIAGQLSLDGKEYPGAYLAKCVAELPAAPQTPADKQRRERDIALDHGTTVRRAGQSDESIRELASTDWRYRNRLDLQRSFLIGAGIDPDTGP